MTLRLSMIDYDLRLLSLRLWNVLNLYCGDASGWCQAFYMSCWRCWSSSSLDHPTYI